MKKKDKLDNKESKGKNKKNITASKIIFVIALIVFFVSGYKLYTIWKEYNDNEQVYDEVKEYKPKKVKDKDEYEFTKEDYDKLKGINSDFIGWIYIPNTNVDYPIVQTTDNDYYLSHNFYKEYNSGGCIFVASEIEEPFKNAKNTIIHGHHMRDGSMFGSLMKFKDNKFFDDNKIIYIGTEDGVHKYEIFSAYWQKVNDDPYQYGFESDEKYIEYLNGLKQKSAYTRDTDEFTANDKIITLSTCSYEVDDGRYLIHARLID